MAMAMRDLGPRELGFFGWLWFRARRRAVAWIRENDPVTDWDERDYLASWSALRVRMRERIEANVRATAAQPGWSAVIEVTDGGVYRLVDNGRGRVLLGRLAAPATLIFTPHRDPR